MAFLAFAGAKSEAPMERPQRALYLKRKGNIFVTKNLPQIAYFYHLFFETTNIFVFLHLKNECAARKKNERVARQWPQAAQTQKRS